ncbi:protein ABA AND ROS SENSITIVE 1 [Cornus florida]|uniref:protein ABA AND ROS SENSITIVE 1 n=1 Tax=Cornus florida TaxID=4283 RepID=UPI00289A85FF|nr:protein ABA AND ROS SENSITIVE 1 [Cornus florida]XP_059623232.1 protein ABA AND ROS SENSITIVE 1 [Cornus florida]XP_059623234.1 protein ABA AND ROS SENSITIVE 1 [Cornus florida]
MDAQAKKKALYRAKLNAQKQKRIDSPLVRYNESDQPVCRVCDVVLKSESLWPAHQASRKHHEAISKVKANAAGVTHVNNVKAEPPVELRKPKPVDTMELQNAKPEPSTGLPKPRPSSVLPSDFFDNQEKKRQKVGNPDSYKKVGVSAQTQVTEPPDSDNKMDGFSSAKVVETKADEIQPAMEHTQTSKVIVDSETKQVKGALPEGFFDDKDADLRARGITPVKLDAKDEYKEFAKLIQEDLQEVDNRLEEEEYDAADMIDEAEHSEQKTLKERMEMWKKKKMELKAARSATHSRGPEVKGKESRHEESSSDDDSDENFTVDWRAKRL